VQVLFFPEFADRDQLSEAVYRAHWYLEPFRAELELIAPHRLDDATLSPIPDYLDVSLAERAHTAPLHSLARVEDGADLAKLVREADVVLLWRADLAGPGKTPRELKGKKVVRIDHEREQFASSHYLKFAERFFQQQQRDDLVRSQAVFARIRERCAGRMGYIFGTGPGLASRRSRRDVSGA
jgi:hypothetical protein